MQKFLSLFLAFSQVAGADPAYVEKVFSVPGGETRAVYREVHQGSDPGFREWRLNDRGQEIARSTQIAGHKDSVAYSVPVSNADSQSIGRYMDGVSATTGTRNGGMSMSLVFPWIDSSRAVNTMRENAVQAQRSADRARVWAESRIAERQSDLANRGSYLESLNNGVARMEVENQKRFSQNLASLFAGGSPGEVIGAADQARLWNDFFNAQPRLESIRINPAAETELAKQISGSLESGDWESAGESISDIASPLNVSQNADAQRRALSARGWTGGTAETQDVYRRDLYSPHANPQLEDARLRTLNSLYARGNSREDFTAGPGRDVGQASLMYLKAARDQERAGNPQLAQKYAQEALRLARGEGVAAETLRSDDRSFVANSYRAYLGQPLSNAPTGGAELARLGTGVIGKLQSEDRGKNAATLAAGSHFFRSSGENFASGDSETAQIFLKMGMLAVDVTLGFIPPVALVRDAYEFTTGKNMLTGEQLTDLERAIAGVGLLSAGTASGMLRGAGRFAKLAAKSGVPEVILRKSTAGMSLLTQAGFKTPRTIEVLRSKVRGAPDQWKALNDAVRSLGAREHALPFKYVTRKAEYTNVLNATYAARLKGHRPYVNDEYSLIGKVAEVQDGLVRFYKKGVNSPAGFWLVHKSSVAGLTPQEVSRRLNIPIPDSVADFVPKFKAGEEITIRSSRIGRNAMGGPAAEEGAMQFELIMENLPREWFDNERAFGQL